MLDQFKVVFEAFLWAGWNNKKEADVVVADPVS